MLKDLSICLILFCFIVSSESTCFAKNSLGFGGPAITLWFDDAWISQYNIAYPIMKEYGFRGSVAVPTNFIEGQGQMTMVGYQVTRDNFMTWEQLKELQQQGWEIDSHTKSHSCDLDFYTRETLKQEFSESRKVLQSKGFAANNFVMPCGTWRSDAPFLSEEAEKYYDSYRSLQPEINPVPLENTFDIKAYFLTNKTQLSDVQQWIELAKKHHGWLILTFHIIDNSHDNYAVTPVFFKRVLQLVADSKIPVVLPNRIISNKPG